MKKPTQYERESLEEYARLKRERDARLAQRDREYALWMKKNGISYKTMKTPSGGTISIRGQGIIASKANMPKDVVTYYG